MLKMLTGFNQVGSTFTSMFSLYSKTEEPTAKKLFYKPFSPGKLNLPYVHEDIDQLESAFEDLRGVEQRINKWLAVSGKSLPMSELQLSKKGGLALRK